ncbi:MAG: TonB-dependent receptor [Prevotella sp.]|nr:TonB-dependent receptor [Prevotella sp.]MCI1281933.1 TonB-dependent receptor [Prevotella sp.]
MKNQLSWFTIRALTLVLIFSTVPCKASHPGLLAYDSGSNLYTLYSAKEYSVKEIFDYIEKHSKYVFAYNKDVKKMLSDKVSINLTNKNAELIIKELCQEVGLSYNISGRQVSVTKNDVPSASTRTPSHETFKIRGKVVDVTGEPLIGVSVKIDGGGVGAVSDIDGSYSIEVPVGSKLIFSYIGYLSQKLAINKNGVYNVTLAEDVTTLEETVVIGYGTIKKKDLTGSVAAVKGSDLANRHTTTLSTALQGSVSGLMVRRSGNAPGSSASSIYVRGVTTIGDSRPLVIVDGVESSLDNVNTNDVESISVLKDAAAASIYGSKAAAGVILVTTKRGEITDKVSLIYTGELGWEIPTRQPSMVGVTRYLEMNNELMYNDNPSGGYFQVYTADQTKNWVKNYQKDPNNYPITDWNDLILKKSAPRMTHTLTLNGGNKIIKTNVTLSYDDVKGLYGNNRFQRYMMRVNNDFTISDKLSATLDVSIRYAKNVAPNYSPFNDLRKMPAVYPAMWADGRIASGKSGANPYGLLQEGGSSTSSSTQAFGKGSIKYTPIKGLSLEAVIAPFINYQKQKAFRLAASYNQMDDPDIFGGYLDGNGFLWATNKLDETRNDNYHVTSQLLANYMRDFGKHSLTFMAGYENYVAKSENLTASRDQYELTNYPYLNIGPEDFKDNSGTGSSYTSNSFFGRILYSYAERYLFQANVRHDGSSRFAKNYRWGTFPSVSAGWVISEEKFWQNLKLDWFSHLKLRASWGKLGNERIGSNYFPYIALMSFGNSFFYMADGTVLSQKTARPGTLAVEDITWETTTSTDLGLDASFLNNRLRFTADYYWKKTTDMLLNIEIPYTMGFSNPSTNAGKMSTHGYDLELSWNDHIGNLKYGISTNFSDFISKIDYLNGADIISSGRINRAGEYFNAYYGYKCEGIYQTQEEVNNSARTSSTVTVGDLHYKDISGPDGVPDGIISPEYDRIPLGNSLPRFQYGGVINASWKNIDFSMAFQGVGKQNSYLSTSMVQPLRDNYGNIPAIIEGRYWSAFNTTEENSGVCYPRLSNVSKGNNYAISDFWMFNGHYFRMKNITLGYTLPMKFINSIGLKKVRFYASSSDLFCISNFPKGWDPEMGTSDYPITTSLLFGMSVNF